MVVPLDAEVDAISTFTSEVQDTDTTGASPDGLITMPNPTKEIITKSMLHRQIHSVLNENWYVERGYEINAPYTITVYGSDSYCEDVRNTEQYKRHIKFLASQLLTNAEELGDIVVGADNIDQIDIFIRSQKPQPTLPPPLRYPHGDMRNTFGCNYLRNNNLCKE